MTQIRKREKTENKSILMIMMVIIMMFLFVGCSLAKENGEEDASAADNKDRLIGVFITNQSLDIEDKVYATIDKKDSNDPIDWEISFEGIEGINFLHGEFQDEGGETFSMVFSDAICDVKTHYITTDDGESVELTGTLYTIMSNKEVVFFGNPVYQTAKGDIYVTPGTGSALDGSSIGVSLTESMEEEWITTVGKERQSGSAKVTVNYALSYKPLQIRVHQMSTDNQVIKTDVYVVGEVPENLLMENSTAYLLVETQWEHPEIDGYFTRELYEQTEEETTNIETFVVTKNGNLEKRGTTITFSK